MKTVPPKSFHTNPSLFSLFLVYLKAGIIGFGGYLALISIIEKEVSTKRKWCTREDILDSIALSAILPGPLAVNACTFIAYRCAGLGGALLGMFGLILPSFLMMIIAASYYSSLSWNSYQIAVLRGFSAATAGIVSAMVITLGVSQIKSIRNLILASLCFISMYFLKGYSGIVCCILFGVLMVVTNRNGRSDLELAPHAATRKDHLFTVFLIILSGLLITNLPLGSAMLTMNQNILKVFSSLSLLMFGGGYVAIPIMKNTIVDQLHWISLPSFSHAISLGQITPGPVMISAAFIGYCFQGLLGALLATIGMFLPTGLLMIAAANGYSQFTRFKFLGNLVMSFRVAAVGMIGSAALFLGLQLGSTDYSELGISILLYIITAFLALSGRVSTGVLIIGSGISAAILNMLLN